MWAEILVGVAVLVLCAFGSYQLVRAQRKKAALEKQEAEAE